MVPCSPPLVQHFSTVVQGNGAITTVLKPRTEGGLLYQEWDAEYIQYEALQYSTVQKIVQTSRKYLNKHKTVLLKTSNYYLFLPYYW